MGLEDVQKSGANKNNPVQHRILQDLDGEGRVEEESCKNSKHNPAERVRRHNELCNSGMTKHSFVNPICTINGTPAIPLSYGIATNAARGSTEVFASYPSVPSSSAADGVGHRMVTWCTVPYGGTLPPRNPVSYTAQLLAQLDEDLGLEPPRDFWQYHTRVDSCGIKTKQDLAVLYSLSEPSFTELIVDIIEMSRLQMHYLRDTLADLFSEEEEIDNDDADCRY